MNKFIFRQSMILFMAAAVWGVAFVAQSVGMDYVDLLPCRSAQCGCAGSSCPAQRLWAAAAERRAHRNKCVKSENKKRW